MQKKVLLITEEINKNSLKNGFVHSEVLDLEKQIDKLIIICLRKGENNLSNKTKIFTIEGGRLAKAIKVKMLAWRLRSSYDEVIVHRNPEYIVICGFLWKLLGKKIYFFYSHKYLDWKVKLATKLSMQVLTNNQNDFPIKTNKLKVIPSLSYIFEV